METQPAPTYLGRTTGGKLHGLTREGLTASSWCGRQHNRNDTWSWLGIAAGETDVTCERCLAARPDYISKAPLVVYGARS